MNTFRGLVYTGSEGVSERMLLQASLDSYLAFVAFKFRQQHSDSSLRSIRLHLIVLYHIFLPSHKP